MKKNVSKAIALIMTMALLFSFAACGGKDNKESSTDVSASQPVDATVNDSTVPATEQSTDNSSTSANEPSTAAHQDGVTPPTKAPSGNTAPTAKADILALFNNASAKAVNEKVGFAKVKTTKVDKLDMGALGKLSIVRDTIADFLDEGTVNTNAPKGWNKDTQTALIKSVLTSSDVTGATCVATSDGKFYEITLTLAKDDKPVKGSSTLGRLTNDFKSAKEIADGLVEAEVGFSTVDEQIPSATVKAKIEISTGKLVSMENNFKFNAQITDVKYTIVKVKSAKGEASTTVKYSNFIW